MKKDKEKGREGNGKKDEEEDGGRKEREMSTMGMTRNSYFSVSTAKQSRSKLGGKGSSLLRTFWKSILYSKHKKLQSKKERNPSVHWI